MQNFYLEAAPDASASMMGTFLPLILMVVVFYFILIRPQKKRDKEAQAMRKALEVGDEIVTVGGILGRVVSVREDSLLIESGSSNTKMRITTSAVQANLTAQENARERQAELAEQRQREKEAKAQAKAESKGKKVDDPE